jgi:Putative Ig domain
MDALRTKYRLTIVAVTCAWLLGGCSAATQHAQVATSSHDTGLRLSPDPAYAGAEIRIVFDDAWIRPEACRYLWRRNGDPIPGAVGSALDPTQFTKHDRIGVEVTTPAEAGKPSQILHAELVIANTPPRVTRAWLSTSAEAGVASLVAGAETVDADRDSIKLTYRWFKNDRAMDGVTAATLPTTSFGRGDRVTVEVVADDGDSRSPALRSDPLQLDNHPPQFTSQPLSPRPTDLEYHYQALAADPDGDALKYQLDQGPNGMTVDDSGNLAWSLPTGDERRGDFPVTIRATDPGGMQATQQFTIHLEPAPAPKQAPAGTPASPASTTLVPRYSSTPPATMGGRH